MRGLFTSPTTCFWQHVNQPQPVQMCWSHLFFLLYFVKQFFFIIPFIFCFFSWRMTSERLSLTQITKVRGKHEKKVTLVQITSFDVWWGECGNQLVQALVPHTCSVPAWTYFVFVGPFVLVEAVWECSQHSSLSWLDSCMHSYRWCCAHTPYTAP